MNDCLSRDQILSYLAQQMPTDKASQVETHIETCPDCRRQLEQLTVPPDSPLANGQRVPTQAPLPQFPGYELRGVLGAGGMGVVYRCWT